MHLEEFVLPTLLTPEYARHACYLLCNTDPAQTSWRSREEALLLMIGACRGSTDPRTWLAALRAFPQLVFGCARWDQIAQPGRHTLASTVRLTDLWTPVALRASVAFLIECAVDATRLDAPHLGGGRLQTTADARMQSLTFESFAALAACITDLKDKASLSLVLDEVMTRGIVLIRCLGCAAMIPNSPEPTRWVAWRCLDVVTALHPSVAMLMVSSELVMASRNLPRKEEGVAVGGAGS